MGFPGSGGQSHSNIWTMRASQDSRHLASIPGQGQALMHDLRVVQDITTPRVSTGDGVSSLPCVQVGFCWAGVPKVQKEWHLFDSRG